MKKIKLNLGKRSYNIVIGHHIIKDIAKLVSPSVLNKPILVITNKKVARVAGGKLLKALKAIGAEVHGKEVPDSERAKSFATYSKITTELSRIGKKIKPTIIALGGGVVGDVAGFAASTYRRGIPYIQIPTTLLAQVDSSIGGKVAIDLKEAKNLVGSFYQPRAVICDLSFLKTLPRKEIINGLAEIIKYGIIRDKALFNYIEKNLQKILNLSGKYLEYVVWKCASIKARVVEKDEFDSTGIRVILNFGHTFAHAIENAFKYSKKHTHGESVAVGMVLASDMAFDLGILSSEDFERIRNLVKRAGLPTAIQKADIGKLMKAIEYDKKFLSGTNRFVLPRRVGRVETVEDIPEILIETVFKRGGA